MDIIDIDKNFKLPKLTEENIQWRNALETPFSLHGIFYDYEREEYRRMPYDLSGKVSSGVQGLSAATAGGRLRFVTNSPFIALKCVIPAGYVMPHMPCVGSHGFGIYANGVYFGNIALYVEEALAARGGTMAFAGIRQFPFYYGKQADEYEIELCFPLYNGVNALYIGVKNDCYIKQANSYNVEKPIVFYGSSITQGGCASHPGNEYTALVSRWLNADYINLGFSGNAKGERQMGEYLASLDASAFVIDYDHNAQSVKDLQETHYPLYEVIRKKRPQTPILFLSRPGFEYCAAGIERREVIKATYDCAVKNGDKNVAFIEGEKLFGEEDRDACTVDNVHPTDLGFYRMAKTVLPTLKALLER